MIRIVVFLLAIALAAAGAAWVAEQTGDVTLTATAMDSWPPPRLTPRTGAASR